MQGYVTLKKKKSKLGKTLTIVAIIHIIVGGGMVWLATTDKGREIMTVYKLSLKNIYEPPPPPPEVKVPEPEPPPPPPPEEAPKPPEPVQEAVAPEPPQTIQPPAESVKEEPPPQVRLPGFGNPFGAGGKKGKFGGYADLVTVEIQRLYKQPADLPDDTNMMVQFQIVLNEEGNILNYKLVKSSGNQKFDQSALQAVGRLQRLRPPPEGMSHTLVVKFFHKLYNS
ncbi:MAG: TonB family protein [Nitrospiria bacterium]